MYRFRISLVCGWLCLAANALAQTGQSSTPAQPAKNNWFDKFSLRGYAQFRYNRLFETNPDLKCEQCDRSIGKGQQFGFRRARLVFSGNPHDRVFTYLQFDYSSDASSTGRHFLQVRDAYFDYYFDPKKDFRVRLGQSKVPYGFENMQSSSNRLPLDRADALNSAAPNERDIGAFAMYTPKRAREIYKKLQDDGLKHSGDYGMAAFGLYNGQSANKPELNDNLHSVVRISYPFRIDNQIVEPGIQAYSGQFTLAADQVSSGTKTTLDRAYTDERVAASFVLFAKPIGILAEYNWGRSPAFDPATDSVSVKNLRGGFITISYRKQLPHGSVQPFVRFQEYEGGKKHELDARHYQVRETEIGVEWQLNKAFELTASYVISNRQYQDFKTRNYDESGRFLRLQAQFNY
ncbi:MAG: porin [Saprospiraceae bacterium]